MAGRDANKSDASSDTKILQELETTRTPESLVAQSIAEQRLEEIQIVVDEKDLTSIEQTDMPLTHKDLMRINTREGLVKMLSSRRIRLNKVVEILNYEEELALLQIQLVKFQQWVQREKKRIAILFEGRDAAGKGGSIRRFTEHLNPRSIRVVALPAPTEVEKGQWYFQRYITRLPNPGEIVFFDRSWYNRAVVEPVNDFCSREEYERFMRQVPEYEHMLYDDGVEIVKFWFSISKKEQLKRFNSRRKNPLKRWKLSPVDEKAQSLWDTYTHYKKEMFSRTHTSYSPWVIVQANIKRIARLESIRHVLSLYPYEGKDLANLRIAPNPSIVGRYHERSRLMD